jgi:hypothetical protein
MQRRRFFVPWSEDRRGATRVCLQAGQIIAITASGWLCGCEMTVTRSVEAVVLAAEGAVFNTTGTSDLLAINAHLGAGTLLRIDADARVALSLLPGALVDLQPDSEMRLRSLKLTKNGNRVQEAMQRQVRLKLERGVLVASVAFDSREEDVSIETPMGALMISSPALARVEVRNDVTRVTCARGVVSFRPNGEATAITMTAPAFREWPSRDLEQIPADFDVRAMEEIENSKHVEQKLLGLEQRRRMSPFPWRQQ